MGTKRTIILDTNIWSRVAEAKAGERLRAVAHQSELSVIAVPSVLYELAEIPVEVSRARALRVITETHWKRLMPEAYLEAMEIVEALRVHRPEWIIREPDLREFNRTEYDWRRVNTPAKRRARGPNKAGTWERFRFSPEAAHHGLKQLDGDDRAVAREDAKLARREMFDQGGVSPGPLRSVMASFRGPRPGWRGDGVAMWRAEAMESFTFYLFGRRGGPYHDWISPFVDLSAARLQPVRWNRFWLYEASEGELSRQWMRWAFRYLSRFRRVSPGTPGDVQLSAYLYDADLVASNDKLFVELVAECAPAAPQAIARPILVKDNPSVVEHLFQLLPTLGKR